MVGGHPNPTDVPVSRLSRVDVKTNDKKGVSGFDNKHTARGGRETHRGHRKTQGFRNEQKKLQFNLTNVFRLTEPSDTPHTLANFNCQKNS